MKTVRVCAVIMCLVVLPMAAVEAGSKGAEKAAASAAEQWLKLIDEGRYADSWRESAGYFRGAVTQTQWVQSLEGVRRPIGNKISRKLLGASYTTSLPGAPDGEYVVVQFTSSFENKKNATETVTPMLERDGTWRVSGYFIK